jgi:phosphoglycolate phosphatase
MVYCAWPKGILMSANTTPVNGITKAILFDLDGTLIDSAPVIAAVLNGMREESGQAAFPIAQYRRWISLGANELISRALEVPADLVAPLLATFRARYQALPTPDDVLYAHARETLRLLESSGFALAICSNKPQALCEKVLHETDLARYFSCIVGSGRTAQPKPDRAPLDFALNALQASPQHAVLVGDSTVDQAAAKAAQLRFVFFSSGYDDGVQAEQAWRSVDALAQLMTPNFFNQPTHNPL